MIFQTFIGRHPGKRIQGYRNSLPRYIKVIGLGKTACGIVSDLNSVDRPNVLTTGEIASRSQQALDGPINGLRPNAVIVVCQKGEDEMFPFTIDHTASMLSLIVIDAETPNVEESHKVREIQKVADLYVTTSNKDFVAELVENLAS
jgi:hypothetical protein